MVLTWAPVVDRDHRPDGADRNADAPEITVAA
jgi:hypothetical protein